CASKRSGPSAVKNIIAAGACFISTRSRRSRSARNATTGPAKAALPTANSWRCSASSISASTSGLRTRILTNSSRLAVEGPRPVIGSQDHGNQSERLGAPKHVAIAHVLVILGLFAILGRFPLRIAESGRRVAFDRGPIGRLVTEIDSLDRLEVLRLR